MDRLATLFEEEVSGGKYLDGGNLTFAAFVDRWLNDYAEKQLQPKTLHRYKSLLKRIVPAIGHKKLNKLQPTDLLELYNNLSEKGMREDIKYIALPELKQIIETKGLDILKVAAAANISERTIKSIISGNPTSVAPQIAKVLEVKLDKLFIPKEGEELKLSDRTILHHHRMISTILTSAVQWQLIASNPCERVKPPKVEKTEAAHYDENTTVTMLEKLENEPIKYSAMVSLTAYAGLRRGELCGLEWPDVDFTNKLLSIHQASQYIPGQGIFTKEPKNETSVRIISLPEIAIDLLRKYKSWWNEEKLKCDKNWYKDEAGNESNRLFVQWDGKPIFPDTISKWFGMFENKYNLPKLSFHGLRHTNATILIAQGTDIQTVSKRLGHAKPSTTTDIYAHALRRPDVEAAEKLNTLFSKTPSQVKDKQA